MEEFGFVNEEEILLQIAKDATKKACTLGADQAQVETGEVVELDVQVRNGRPESISFNHGISFTVDVLVNKQSGSASCNSLGQKDIDQAIERSIAIARQMQPDDCEGLPLLEQHAIDKEQDLQLYHPWRPTPSELVSIADEMAQTSWSVDKRISREKSAGAGASSAESRSVLANSNGFAKARTGSMHALQCQVIADLEGIMESSGWYDNKRNKDDLENHLEIAKLAAKKAIEREGVKPLTSGKFPVLFENGSSHSLIDAFLSTINGNNVYREISCFANHLEKKLWNDHISLVERPHLVRGTKSALYDYEGVATNEKNIVTDGVLNTYLLNCYTARKLKLQSTANSGGVFNLDVQYRSKSLSDLLKEMDTGLFVTGLMGGGANTSTGDYSAGAYGFWVEGGKIAYPVRDATIAGSLQQMMLGIVAGGDDRHVFGSTDCGSLLIEQMSVAGSK